jgi:prolyl-tRNA editing enzyme YbaK/EbsC (Cys-tRNA(Pro) deacylase)
VELAAQALGVELDLIAKTLAFMLNSITGAQGIDVCK